MKNVNKVMRGNGSDVKYSKSQLGEIMSNVASQNFQTNFLVHLLQKSRLECFYLLLKEYSKRGVKPVNLKALEIGYGSGFNLMVLKQLGFEELGIDVLTPDCWNYALKDNHKFKFNVLRCDITKESLPFPNENFDVVLLIDVLEHLYNPYFTLKEILRVLKNHGLTVIRTPNCANLKNRILLLMGKSPYYNLKGWLFEDRRETPSGSVCTGHIREYTMEEVKQILNIFGFKILNCKYFITEEAITRSRQRLIRLYNLLEILYNRWRYQMVLLAEKKT